MRRPGDLNGRSNCGAGNCREIPEAGFARAATEQCKRPQGWTSSARGVPGLRRGGETWGSHTWKHVHTRWSRSPWPGQLLCRWRVNARRDARARRPCTQRRRTHCMHVRLQCRTGTCPWALQADTCAVLCAGRSASGQTTACGVMGCCRGGPQRFRLAPPVGLELADSAAEDRVRACIIICVFVFVCVCVCGRKGECGGV